MLTTHSIRPAMFVAARVFNTGYDGPGVGGVRCDLSRKCSANVGLPQTSVMDGPGAAEDGRRAHQLPPQLAPLPPDRPAAS